MGEEQSEWDDHAGSLELPTLTLRRRASIFALKASFYKLKSIVSDHSFFDNL